MYRQPKLNLEQSEQADAKALRKATAAVIFSTSIIFFKKIKDDKDTISFFGFDFDSLENSHIIGLIFSIVVINILMSIHYTISTFAFGPYNIYLRLSERLIFYIRRKRGNNYDPMSAKRIARFITTTAKIPSIVAVILGLYVISLGLYLGFNDFIQLIEAVRT